jgi:hypothetical protein
MRRFRRVGCLATSAQVGEAGSLATGGMDPQAHRLDDELQTKARGATGFSSRTKAREVPTPAVPKWYGSRVKRSGDLRKPVVAKSSTDSQGPHGANRKETPPSIGPHP